MIHGDKKLPNLASEALYVNIQRRGNLQKPIFQIPEESVFHLREINIFPDSDN
jgi:hypothetical protein